MGPYIRIGLRYVAGALVARGLLPAELADQLSSDPNVIAAVMMGANWAMVTAGAAVAAATEWAYRFAKKRGWAT